MPKTLIKNLPVWEKPRERFISKGANYISNEELLAIIINTGSKGTSSKQLAGTILSKLNDISDLCHISLTSLTNIKGIGTAKAINILAAIELGKRVYQTNLYEASFDFTNTKLIFEYFKKELSNKNQEHFYVAYLDNQKSLIKYKLLFMGTNKQSLVQPSIIFKEAYLSNASYILCIHNHPNHNIPEPSIDDTILTDKLKKLGELHSIPLLDHIIIGNITYYSYKENGEI